MYQCMPLEWAVEWTGTAQTIAALITMEERLIQSISRCSMQFTIRNTQVFKNLNH